MSLLTQPDPETAAVAVPPAAPPAWRWAHVAVAALAMVATLPGRTHGLGLVTEPLMHDLHLEQVYFGKINFWATLLGAAFCVPCGWLIDRLGVRAVAVPIFAALGAVVMLMSRVTGDWTLDVPAVGAIAAFDLFLLVLLTRGLGQSALSVVSLTLISTAAGRRSGPAMGVYAFLVTFGFMVAFGVARQALGNWHTDWRVLWDGIGIAVLVCGVVAAVLVRPRVSGWTEPQDRSGTVVSHTLGQALATPTFWVFALATSFYGMVAAGVSLFNQSVLAERGFDQEVFLTVTMVAPLIGLAANLLTGWLATRWSLGRLLAPAMLLLAAALGLFPFVESMWQVWAYAAAMGVAGGIVTVLFFAVWGRAFGPAHLGRIQGAAQLLTVLASAAGPWILAEGRTATGSYVQLFRVAAAISVIFALAAWLTPLPNTRTTPSPHET